MLENPPEACEGPSVFKKEVEFHAFCGRGGGRLSLPKYLEMELRAVQPCPRWSCLGPGQPPSGDVSSSALQMCAELGRWQRHRGVCQSGSGLLGAQASAWGELIGLVSRLATLAPSVRQWPIAHALLASKEIHKEWVLDHFCPQTITLSSWTLSGH